MESLLAKNDLGPLTDRERRAIDALRAGWDHLMLRHSYAPLLLKFRGHLLPRLEDL
jgi:hypothetical protein